MINYRKDKQKYKINGLGSLYVDETKLSSHEQPIIYIGGQMEHRCHVIEQTGYTGDLCHNAFTGSWMYDYSVFSDNKRGINAASFSETLLTLLREAKLSEVILLTHSFGGLIGATASKSDLISKVISVHSPILGTPIANADALESYDLLMTKKQKLLLKVLKLVVNDSYGFQRDNFVGVDLREVDLNKLLLVGNYINLDTESNGLILELYEMIKLATGYRNDGVVPFEPSLFDKKGINYLQTDEHRNHFDSASVEYFEGIVQRVLKK